MGIPSCLSSSPPGICFWVWTSWKFIFHSNIYIPFPVTHVNWSSDSWWDLASSLGVLSLPDSEWKPTTGPKMAGCSFPLLDCLPACPVFIRLDPNSKCLCVKAQSFLVITLCDPISTPNISLVSSTLSEHDLVETCWILSPSSAQIHCWLDPVTLLTLLQQHTLEP